MGFWSKYFQQADKISALVRDLEFEQRRNGELVSLLKREEWRSQELEKALVKARNSEIRTLRHHADVISKNAKTQSAFTLIAKEDEPPTPPPVDAALEEKIRWAAETARQMDVDEGVTPMSLEQYEGIVRQNPEQYIFY